MSSRSSSPARAPRARPSACSPPSCSPTSSARPSAPPRPATAPGASCWTTTSGSSAPSSALHGGEEVKTLGDGFLATFDGPARAVRCALRIAERSDVAGVPVRAGLHTGECERVGADVAGIAVHIAARVMGEAGAGEVLVSRTVTDLVAGSGLRFESRGPRALRGVPGEWELFAAADQAA